MNHKFVIRKAATTIPAYCEEFKVEKVKESLKTLQGRMLLLANLEGMIRDLRAMKDNI